MKLTNLKFLKWYPIFKKKNQKVIKKRPSRRILASKISQTHHPNTFWALLLAQSWSRGVSAPSLGAPERHPGPPKTYVFLKENTGFSRSRVLPSGSREGGLGGPGTSSGRRRAPSVCSEDDFGSSGDDLGCL